MWARDSECSRNFFKVSNIEAPRNLFQERPAWSFILYHDPQEMGGKGFRSQFNRGHCVSLTEDSAGL